MPRRKRMRRHRKHNSRNHFNSTDSQPNISADIQDNQLRTCANEQPSINSTPRVAPNLKLTDFETPSPNLFFDVPNVLLISNSNKVLRSHSSSDIITPSTPIRKRRNVARESSTLGYSGLPLLFNWSGTPENLMIDLKTCQSSTLLDQNEIPKEKVRSNSSISKLHSPGIEKIPLKTEVSTQTIENKDVGYITDTPKLTHDDLLLDFDYEIERSDHETPLKRIRTDERAAFSRVKDTNNYIQALNNLHSKNKISNRSKKINDQNLRKLQNFNDIILNTSQSINYENCELLQELENAIEQDQQNETSSDDLNNIEDSFFTPQLYAGKTASTPITKRLDETVADEALPNKVEIVRCVEVERCNKVPKAVSSTSTQVERSSRNIGLQTTHNDDSKITLPSKTKVSRENQCFVITKRRTYKSLSPGVLYYRTSPKRDFRFSPTHRIPLNRTDSVETIAAIETFARIFAKVKKYHGRYSSKLPAKIVEMCSWLGIMIKKGITSLYQLYSEQKHVIDYPNETNCSRCSSQVSQISTLTTTVEELSTEIINIKKDNQNKADKLTLINTEVNQLRRELSQFDDLRKEIKQLKERMEMRFAAPPPPPPPPPPLLPILSTSVVNKPVKVTARKKSNENARPIISLEDILKVKLKKIERPSPLRRATEPLISNALKQVRLRPARSRPSTPSNGSPSSASTVSNSPRSSLTRMLTGVDTHVCRVKRLKKRASAYSFHDFSRRSRDRENYDSNSADLT